MYVDFVLSSWFERSRLKSLTIKSLCGKTSKDGLQVTQQGGIRRRQDLLCDAEGSGHCWYFGADANCQRHTFVTEQGTSPHQGGRLEGGEAWMPFWEEGSALNPRQVIGGVMCSSS